MSDLISRKQAIDALRDEFKRIPTTAIRAMHRIEQLPSAEPKSGKWICTGSPDESWGMMYECSICGNHDYGGNYCSYCGAKMEDEDE